MNNNELRNEDEVKVFFIKVNDGKQRYIGNKSNDILFVPTVTLKHAKKFGTLGQAKRFIENCTYRDSCTIVPGAKIYRVLDDEV